jgi:hypothetical protein
MVTFTAFASGSTGNLYSFEDGETAILIEAGLPYREIQLALHRHDGRVPTDYQGCIVSHEHMDHARAIPDLKRRGVPVYLGSEAHAVTIGTMKVSAFPLIHDVPCSGFRVISSVTKETLIFLTDTAISPFHFPDVNILAIETNFSEKMVGKCSLKERVFTAHMSLERAIKIMERSNLSKCREIHLLHMSRKQCSSCGGFHADETRFIKEVQGMFSIPTYAASACKNTGDRNENTAD